jgi:predicted enzyme related to lactoylglutathione lyase
MTSDTQRSRSFYTELFGWGAEEPNEDFGGYFNFTKDGVRIAGCMGSDPASALPDVWSIYLATDDAAKTVEAASANGAQAIVEAMPVGDLGTMAVVSHPAGGVIGIWQPGLHKGFGILGEPNTPSWFELHTTDFPSAVSFYQDVFHWDTHVAMDTPGFRYTTLGKDEAGLAGIMDAKAFLPEGVPSHWSVYFGTDDADAALAKIVELGGAVVMPAEDTPYGRLATATDPTGAQFKLIAANEAMPAK